MKCFHIVMQTIAPLVNFIFIITFFIRITILLLQGRKLRLRALKWLFQAFAAWDLDTVTGSGSPHSQHQGQLFSLGITILANTGSASGHPVLDQMSQTLGP